MKILFLAFILLPCFQIVAQHTEIQSKIDFFNSKIQQTEKGERYLYRDSLYRLVWDKTELKYDSIARQTIDFAIELDSLTYASNRIVDLMYYHLYIVNQPEQSILLFKTYSVRLENLKNEHAWGKLYLYAGDGYGATNDLDKAIEYYKKAVNFGVKSKKDKLQGLSNLYLGFAQSYKGLFAEAFISFKDASQIFTKLKDSSNLLGVQNGLSILYSKNAFYEEARKEREEAIKIAKKINATNMLIPLYANAAFDYGLTGDRINQIFYLKASLKAVNETNDQGAIKPQILEAFVIAYTESDSVVLAEEKFKELETIYEKDESREIKRYYLKAKKILLFAKKDYNNALILGKEHLQLQNETQKIVDINLSEKFLSQVYIALGEKANSDAHLLNYYKIKDSISSIQNVKSLAYYQTLYQTEKRDLQIENQQASINLLNLKNKNKTQGLIFVSLGLLVLFGSVIIYRSFANAKKREFAQQEFSQALIKTQEQERTRIAKDLHDGVGQLITLFKLKAQNTNQTDLSELAHNALEEVRSISRDLYPVTLAKLGLTVCIEQLLLDLDEETDLFVSIEIDDVNTNFNDIESLNFYRFIQESVNNVLRHAQAKTLIVNILKQRDGIKVLIKDNGRGFEVSKMINQNSLGLKTMAERISILKGSFAIKSNRKEGTSILVQIPVLNV